MRGLVAKTVREVWLGSLCFGLALFGVEVLLAYLPPSFYKDYAQQWMQMPYFRNALSAILSAELGESIGPMAIASLAWAHPIVLALVWTHAILFCTRVPAGEVDHGTIDVLLSLPVSRTRLYACETVVWFGTGLGQIALGLMGNLLGGWCAGPNLHGTIGQVLVVGTNLFALYWAVGGMAWAASAWSDRRGRAVGGVFAVLISSFLLAYLAPFSEVVKKMSFLSILHYYRPVRVLQDGTWPLSGLMVLAGVGLTCWLTGWLIFTRRDICTV